jgi:hypothetical protein
LITRTILGEKVQIGRTAKMGVLENR